VRRALAIFALLLLATPTWAQTPTMVHHIWGGGMDGGSLNGGADGGNGIVMHVDSKAGLAGNAWVLCMTYPAAATITSIATDQSQTFPTAAVSINNSGATLTTAMFVLPNLTAGTGRLTVTFGADVADFQASLTEFYNVATASPVNGTTSANLFAASGAVAAGSFTPTDDTIDNLIVQCALDVHSGHTDGSLTQALPTVGPGFTFAGADRRLAGAVQYTVKVADSGPINPTLTFGTSGDQFNTVAAALKSATAGTAPAAGIRVVRMIHSNADSSVATFTIPFPSSGNTLAMVIGYSTANDSYSTVSDSLNAGNWTKTADVTDAGQSFYRENAMTGDAMTITITHTSPNVSWFILYDITGGATSSFDATGRIDASGTQAAANDNIVNAPDYTPTTNGNGITIANLVMGTGPPKDNLGAGQTHDALWYTGKPDGGTLDSGDGFAHAYYTSSAAQNWPWSTANTVNSAWWGSAISFKEAPAVAAARTLDSPKIILAMDDEP